MQGRKNRKNEAVKGVMELERLDSATGKNSCPSTCREIPGIHRRFLSIDRMRFRRERKRSDAAIHLRTLEPGWTCSFQGISRQQSPD